ncbi:hypothetical protein CYMTET_11802 [Cymbomonas tetramitiformis]|uniref:Golgi apparatus protein 1 n=1 Tax=Cymbomonas tetramitiformis TaxID=36881 RepID=A0AAE0GLZ2_9CHLO|nr:hypothetical protein CYMTET_11802 [Cymbomonas tetramitiformis]
MHIFFEGVSERWGWSWGHLHQDVSYGRGRKLACLQDKRAQDDELLRVKPGTGTMSWGCRSATGPGRATEDGELLRGKAWDPGTVEAPSCRNAVLRTMIHAADNWKLSRPLAEACLPDVKRLCKGVSGGSGKVHECLRRKEAELSAECKEAEKKAEAAEAEDIRLKPELERVCSEAITVHCKDVAPGGGRVINCLIEKASTEPTFPIPCGKRMKNLLDRGMVRLAFNPRVKGACKAVLDEHCSGDSMVTQENSPGLQCLMDHELPVQCQNEVGRNVALALRMYSFNRQLTSVCNNDATQLCGVDNSTIPYSKFGSISECLLRASDRLSGGCWRLVTMPLKVVTPQESVLGAQLMLEKMQSKINEQQNSISDMAQELSRANRAKGDTKQIEQNQELVEAVDNLTNELRASKNQKKSFMVLEGWPAVIAVCSVGIVLAVAGFVGFQKYGASSSAESQSGKGIVYVDKS